MLGYIAGVAFRGVLDGDSPGCASDPPGNRTLCESPSSLLSIEYVSSQQNLSQKYRDALLIHRIFLEPQLAANDSFTCQ